MENSYFKNFINLLDKETLTNYSLIYALNCTYQGQKQRVGNIKNALIGEIYSKMAKELLGLNPQPTQSLNEKISDQENLSAEIKKLKFVFSSVFETLTLEKLYDFFNVEGFAISHLNMRDYFVSYEQITRNIPNRTEMENRELPKDYGQKVLELLKTWKELASDDMKNFCCQILQLFHQKKIDYYQFTTAVFYWALRQEYKPQEIEIIPLFLNNGDINPLAQNSILQTFKSEQLPFCTEKHCEILFEMMKTAPESEQFFFAVNYKECPQKTTPSSFDNTNTITEELRKLGFNIFDRYRMKNEEKCMIASLSMMQILLNITTGKQAILFAPTIGLSTDNDIKNNGIYDTREMGTPFEGVDLPDIADGAKIRFKYEFWKHDFYHGFVASMAPSSHRKVFIKFAKVLKKTSLKMNLELKNEIIRRLIDMETGVYFNKILKDFGEESDKMTFLYYLEQGIIRPAMKATEYNIIKFQCSNSPQKMHQVTHRLGELAVLANKEDWIGELTKLFLKEFAEFDLTMKKENKNKCLLISIQSEINERYYLLNNNRFIWHFIDLTS